MKWINFLNDKLPTQIPEEIENLNSPVLGVHQNHLQAGWLARRIYRTQNIVLLRVMVHYSKRIYSKISKRKRYMGEEVQRKPSTSFQESSHQWNHHKICLIPSATVWNDMYKVLPTKETWLRKTVQCMQKQQWDSTLYPLG